MEPEKLREYGQDTVYSHMNESSKETAPKGAIDQLGFSLIRINHAFVQARMDAKIFMAKWDIKDGFWWLDCELGEEYNFVYVLPQEENKPIKLVIPTSLQMGWIESPPYFCAAAETGRDIAEQYIETTMGSLPNHKFVGYAAKGADFEALPQKSSVGDLTYVVEAYVDGYVAIDTPTSREQLVYVTNAIMTGIHDVFPADEGEDEDPISLKKMKRLDSMWALQKEELGFTFNGLDKTIWLEESK